MAHVMVLDDEPSICWAFRSFLGDDGHRVTVASTAEQGFERFRADPPDVLFLDVRLPGLDGLSALERFRDLGRATPVVVMTAFGTVETAVRAVRGGAFDYLTKPFDLDQARQLVQRALQARHETRRSVTEANPTEAGVLVGRGPAMQAVFKQVAVAASCDAPVLISGESGTGKELVARAIHRHGDRADEPFVAIHLAALPESLVERELFGHERGAFTGAEGAKPGLLDQADSGTIFFDEISEAPPSIQTKLLRVLDGGEYRPVGGGEGRLLRARVLAATNRDLEACVRSGQFRADLFYRLAVLRIPLPPLRDRLEDLPLLWDHFLARIGPGTHTPLDLASPLGKTLSSHKWPGNVRELRNAVEQAARSCRGGRIHLDHLPESVRSGGLPLSSAEGADGLEEAVGRWASGRLRASETSGLYDAFLAAAEAPLLRALYTWAGGSQVKMAAALGLHRTTLRRKLRDLGLARDTPGS